jgi:hypothetical protein
MVHEFRFVVPSTASHAPLRASTVQSTVLRLYYFTRIMTPVLFHTAITRIFFLYTKENLAIYWIVRGLDKSLHLHIS